MAWSQIEDLTFYLSGRKVERVEQDYGEGKIIIYFEDGLQLFIMAEESSLQLISDINIKGNWSI